MPICTAHLQGSPAGSNLIAEGVSACWRFQFHRLSPFPFDAAVLLKPKHRPLPDVLRSSTCES
eukprot:793088-Pelagomonas_calceolata.AAC.1